MQIYRVAGVFHGRKLPEPGQLVGYGAIIQSFQLQIPLPDRLALIAQRNRRYEQDQWIVFSPRYQPANTLYKQLSFALKYEGIQLLIFKKLFEVIEKSEIEAMVEIEPASQYTRRIWYLYEWLMNKKLDLQNADTKIKYQSLADEKLQYVRELGEKSERHRIVNNLLGSRDFCPHVLKTNKLKSYQEQDIKDRQLNNEFKINQSLLQRASAFLLLKDSKASFTIEGESPKSRRTARWGQAIGQAGRNDLTREELIRLQQIVIGNSKHIKMGFRTEGGFIGEHDRETFEPIPEHISANAKDLDELINGLIHTYDLLINSDIDPVIIATLISFGFVYIHPFSDGNGRIHRYLIHDVLMRQNFSQGSMIFPVSSSILDNITEYRAILEHYSSPLLEFIDWKSTDDHNVEVLNETKDFYKYIDLSRQSEFLYACVLDTIDRIIPEEIQYLKRYDTFKNFIDEELGLSDKEVSLMANFLRQNRGKLSFKKRTDFFPTLSDIEIKLIEKNYEEIFHSD